MFRVPVATPDRHKSWPQRIRSSIAATTLAGTVWAVPWIAWSDEPRPITREPHAAWPREDPVSREAHRQLIGKTKQGSIDVYFQGDSITRRWAATDYPELLAHWNRTFHGWNAANFAWGGDSTHHMLWRMRNGELDGVTPKVVCLQAGANNLPWDSAADAADVDDVVSGIQAIVAEFRSRYTDIPVILTAMFPRDQNPKLSQSIDAINQRLEAYSRDDPHIHWVDINAELTDQSGHLLTEVSADGIHLEAAGYIIWGNALRARLLAILGPPGLSDHSPPPTGIPRPITP